MSKLYSTASTAASLTPTSDNLQRFERASSENPNHSLHSQHRRHNSLSGRVCLKTVAKSASITDLANKLEQYESPTTLPERVSPAVTTADPISCNRTSVNKRDAFDEVDSADETRRRRLATSARSSELNTTKDCLQSSQNNATNGLSYDEPDHLQHRFSRTNGAVLSSSVFSARHAQTHSLNSSGMDNGFSDLGCTSGMSSVFSSPSASTVSSPLSSPTRLSPHLQHQQRQHPQQSCCSLKSIASAKNSCSSASSSQQHHLHDPHHHYQHKQQQQQQHQQNHHNHQPHHNHQQPHLPSSSIVSGSKNLKKFDPRLGPSPYRQLLPIALCILSFATVFSILIVYMDTTEIRHQQFRLNMSRDYELYGVAQDDPQLIAFLREIHMRKYPMHFFKTRAGGGGMGSDDSGETSQSSGAAAASVAASIASTGGGGVTVTAPGSGGSSVLPGVDQHYNISAHPNELTPKMAYYVANLLQGKTNGAAIQSLTGSLGHLMTAPWLSETLNWAGIIVEPEPRRYFTLRKQNALRPRMQVVHACVSPNPYPKEVSIHNEESEVRINSLLDEETSWFNSRVKCFPLYTIMLASNRVEYDLLSLGVHGHELEILQTLPFEKIKIEIISIHLLENQEDVSSYVQTITKFLQGKAYKLQKKFGRNYFYQRLTTTSATTTRTRKKDILLLKTP